MKATGEPNLFGNGCFTRYGAFGHVHYPHGSVATSQKASHAFGFRLTTPGIENDIYHKDEQKDSGKLHDT
jgi:hypothetical protein